MWVQGRLHQPLPPDPLTAAGAAGRQVRALSFCLPFRPGDIGASPLDSQPSPSCLFPVRVSIYCLLAALIIFSRISRESALQALHRPSAAHRGLAVGTEAWGDESPLLKAFCLRASPSMSGLHRCARRKRRNLGTEGRKTVQNSY